MGCLLAIFLAAALVFVGFGFFVHLLWIGAILFLMFWVIGFAFGLGHRRARRG